MFPYATNNQLRTGTDKGAHQPRSWLPRRARMVA
jgi:hypothetical protein